ncbi:MAG TPA: hypothetical protein VLX44_06760 [Xanthobacteraceae bacterium]|nr:hypothetical protein [Xanthobacteraceae bacterium]
MSKVWPHIIYLLSTGMLVLVALELLFRFTFSDPENYWSYRFSFISVAAFENRGEGFWTFRPHTTVREVAVYAVASPSQFKTDFVVESDCRTNSNNLGLLQRDDIEAGSAATVILGDSFTEGQGGCPWFDRLQSHRKNDRLVNGGLMGTGFEQWRRLVAYLQRRGVDLKGLLAIAISDDFKRGTWNWSRAQVICLNHGPCPQEADANLWQPLADDESQDTLLARAAARFANRYPGSESRAWLDMLFEQYSYLYKFSGRAAATLRGVIAKHAHAAGVRAENVAALDSLKRIGIPFQVLMVPQRGEINLLADHPDADAAIVVLKDHSIPYRWCRLSEHDFMPYDGHPNRAGYDKIAACADSALGRLEQSTRGAVALR